MSSIIYGDVLGCQHKTEVPKLTYTPAAKITDQDAFLRGLEQYADYAIDHNCITVFVGLITAGEHKDHFVGCHHGPGCCGKHEGAIVLLPDSVVDVDEILALNPGADERNLMIRPEDGRRVLLTTA
jgi:hypothetical protein